MKIIKALFFVGLFGALASCSSTQTTASWVSPHETETITSKKVAVLAVMGNLGVRQSFEQEIVNQLQQKSIGAIGAMQLLPPQRKQDNVDQMIRALHQQGVEAVMVVSLSDVNRKKQYVRGSTYIAPRTYYRRFGDYYVHSYRRVHTPGYIQRTTTYYLESSIYDLSDQTLIWTSEAKSTDPYSLKNASRSYAKSIVKSLNKDALI